MDVTKTHVAVELKHDSPLISCRFNPAGSFVYAGAQDYNVWRMEVATGNKVAFPTDAWVRSMAFCDDGKTLITGGYDGRLIYWPADSDDPKPLRAVEAHDGWIRAIDVSPDGSLVASVGNNLVVRIWNTSDGKLVREMKGHESYVYNVRFHPSGQHLATGDLMCNLIHWDVATGKQIRTWKAESLQVYDKTFVATIGGFRGMTFSGDGSELFVSGTTNVTNAFAGVGNPSVVVFDWEAGKQTIEHLAKTKVQGVAWGLAIHPDGTRIAASGGSGGFMLFWKPKEVNEFHSLKMKDNARDMDLSSDGLHLVTAHYNGFAYVSLMDEKKAKPG